MRRSNIAELAGLVGLFALLALLALLICGIVPEPYRGLALFLVGLLTLAVGAFLSNQKRLPGSAGLFSRGLFLAGVLLLIGGIAVFASSRNSRLAPTSQPAALKQIKITLETPLDQAVVGKTTLVVLLRDAQNKPVNGARIDVTGDMTHAGMMPSLGKAESNQGGRYEVPFEWTMGGDWILTVKATLADDQVAQETFKLSVKVR